MTFQPGAVLYTQGFGSVSGATFAPHIDVRPPTTSDGVNQQFPVGKVWVDTVNLSVYILAGFQSLNGTTVAHWVLIATGTGTIDTLTTDSGVVVSNNGNVNLFGTANQISTAGSGSTATLSIPITFIAPGSAEITSSLTVNGGTNLQALLQVGTCGINASGSGQTVIGNPSAGTITLTSSGLVSLGSLAGPINLDTTASGSTIQMGVTNVTQNIVIGTGPGNKTVTVGSNTGTSTTTLQSGPAGGVSINPTTGGSIAIGSTTGGNIQMYSASDITISSFGNNIFISGQGTGNVTILDANLIISTGNQIRIEGNDPGDSIGTATLANGTVTVANTNIAANDLIFLQLITPNASTAIGTLRYNMTPGVNFNILSIDPASPGSLVLTDESTVAYVIIRQLP